MSGQSLTEIIERWADEAAFRAAGGDVHEESLRALLGPQFDSPRPRSQTRASYQAMLARLRSADQPLVLKLVVLLTEKVELDLVPPRMPEIEREVDHERPPSLVVHKPMVRRDWEDLEEYRCPLSESWFVDPDGEVLADGLYIAVRTSWEISDNSAYRRQLLFERVQS